MQKRKQDSSSKAFSKKEKSTVSSETQRILDLADSQVLPFILSPISTKEFIEEYWEKKPLHVSRDDRSHFDGIFSKSILDNLLRERPLEYKFNINVCQFIDGVKVDQNPDGEEQVDPSFIHKSFASGSTLQALHPQQYTPAVWKINAALEQTFGCLVGANCYLTPPNSQGLAPHYDDIEAFVLQLEGSKRWRIYAPSLVELPREHSGDLPHSAIGAPAMEVLLRAGETLYFPRGWIHEVCAMDDSKHLHSACTQEGEASTHLTISTYQKTAWIDFLMAAVQKAGEKAAAAEVEFRRGLPLRFLQYLGTGIQHVSSGTDSSLASSFPSSSTASSSSSSSSSSASQVSESDAMAIPSFFSKDASVQRDQLQHQFGNRLSQMFDLLKPYLNMHDAADQFSADFMQNRLPPFMPSKFSFGNPESATQIRLIDATSLRMMIEPDEDGEMCVFLAMSADNAHEYHMDGRFSKQPEIMKLPLSCASALAHLFASHPKFVSIAELPIPVSTNNAVDDTGSDDDEDDMRSQLVAALLESKVAQVK